MRYRARGQSLVEFALVLPFLVLILMGIMDFSYYIYSYSELENATRRASEFLSKTDPSKSACQTAATTDAAKSVFFSSTTSTLPFVYSTVPATSPKPGDTVKVQLSNYPVRWLTPVGSRFFSGARFNFTSQRIILSTADPASGSC